MNFRVHRNRQGRGRWLSSSSRIATPTPNHKNKKTKPSSAAEVLPSLTDYFRDIQDKLHKRVNTLVQLEITDLEDPQLVEHVLVSGNTSLKKMQQLVAFLTGCTRHFDHRLQRGASVKDCRFELSLPGYRTCWIATTSEKKKAKTANADHVDRNLKIVQVFQGLSCRPVGGLTYEHDADLAQTIASTPTALVFVTPTGHRLSVQAKAIFPRKAAPKGRATLLPRIVT